MSLIRPFKALTPTPKYAQKVIAPPYDVLNSEEARQKAAGNELSFLHVSKPEIDLPEDTDPYAPLVYQKGQQTFAKWCQQGLFQKADVPEYLIYQMEQGDLKQTGLVCAASVSAYDANLIRKHEFTRPKKETDRVNHIESLQAQTGPVLLTCRSTNVLVDLLNQASLDTVDIQGTLDGVEHRLWHVSDPHVINALTKAIDDLGVLYIADGHHRSAAASRVAYARREAGCREDDPSQYFLSVVIPDAEMKILDYNRVVKDLNGMSTEVFLEAIAHSFEVRTSSSPVSPNATEAFGLYLNKQWYELRLKESLINRDDPIESLSVSMLARFIIEPLLGIDDPRNDDRIDFVGGTRGLHGLEARVDSGEMRLAFSLYPTPMEALLKVADAGEVMPPKSTWFVPKLADGLVIHETG